MAARGTRSLPLLAGLAGVLGLAAAAYLLLDDRPDAVDSGSGHVVSRPDQAPSTPDESRLPVYVPEERDEPPPAAAPPTGGVRGRLVDAFRLPVTRGEVAAYAGRKSLFLTAGSQLTTLGLDPVKVSGEGRFQIDDLPVGTDIVLAIQGDSFVRSEAGPYSILPGETKDLGDIVTEQGYTISGSVRDSAGNGISGARVALAYGSVNAQFIGDTATTAERLVVTDDDGLFELAHAPRWPFILAVSASGFANATVQGGSTTGDDLSDVSFSIVLEQAKSLRGLVLAEEDDTPLSGITLIAVNQDLPGSQSLTTSDRDGRFVFEDLAAGAHRIQADGVGWAKSTKLVPAGALDRELVVHMKEEGSLRGRVTDPDGEPVPRYDLRVFFGNTKTTADSPTEVTQRIRGSDGGFEIPNLETGWYRLEAWAKGFALTTTDPIRVRAGQAVGGLSITMQYGATIRGRVVNDLDQPIAGAAISLHSNNLASIEFLRVREWDAAWQLETHTDDDGVFQLIDVSERAYQVQVDHPDYPVFLVNDVITHSGRLADIQTIVVPRPGTITGVAMDVTGQVLTRGTVSLGGPVSRNVKLDADGRFRFGRLLPGDYYLDARSDKPSSNFSFALEIQRGIDLQPIHVRAGEVVTATASSP